MSRHSATARISALLLGALFLVLSMAAQAPAPTPAAVPLREEPHHHLVFENSYVRAYYVEVTPHESTLQHRHDLSYFGVLLSGGPATNAPAAAATQQSPESPRAIFSPGGISHTVGNPADVPFRNVTVELLHPQGKARNRCRELVQGQPLEQCDMPAAGQPSNPFHYAVFETAEILVEYWEIGASFTAKSWDSRRDTLLVALDGASVSAAAGLDSRNAARGGLLWIPAGSNPVFKTSPDHPGHFFAITFKDSAPAQR